MQPELIVMFTYDDQTVENAHELFQSLAASPVTHFGFKDVGLPKPEMIELIHTMKAAGKTTYLEVVSLSEEEGLRGAQIAAEVGIDILMGTVFFDSIHKLLADSNVQYYPFIGHVHGHPSNLDGTIEEIVEHARSLEAKGVEGIDLLSYRYSGDAIKLLREVVQATNIPIVSAGSISSYDRIRAVGQTGCWGFTIGTAFFDKKFVPDGSFDENVLAVYQWLTENEVAPASG